MENTFLHMDAVQQSKQTRLTFSDIELARQLFGEQDNHLKQLSDQCWDCSYPGETRYTLREKMAVDLSRRVLEQLYGLLKEKYPVYPNDIDYALQNPAERITRQT
jgi:phosphate starvation-inducible PhoH-like protein